MTLLAHGGVTPSRPAASDSVHPGHVGRPAGPVDPDRGGPGDTGRPIESMGDSRIARLAGHGVAPLLVVVDVLAVVIGVGGAEILGRFVLGEDSPARKTLLFGLVFLLCMWQAGLYRSRLSLSILDDLPAISGRVVLAVGLSVLGQVAWSNALWADYIVNWRFLWGAVAIGGLVVLMRTVGYAVVRTLRSQRRVVHRTLILGAGAVGHQVADILTSHPEFGLHPIGFVDPDPRFVDGGSGLPVFGGPERLADLLVERRVGNVVVAFSSMKESQMVSLIRTCDRNSCELFMVPRLFELHQTEEAMDNAWGLPLVRLRRATYRSQAWRVKRLVDIAFSGLAVLLLAPLLVGLAVAVRLDGGPGVLFRQERVGVDGRPFQVLKFRPLRPVDESESATQWNISLDSRLSPLGRMLRKTSLDELPQLLNILRGDMSLVGPRPERPHFVSQFRDSYPSYGDRHRVPSGLTGWAQIHGLRGDTSIADRARFDNYYIENWSLWLDVKIILRTVSSVVKATGG